ncbi:MAG: hypothetical protein JSU96_20400, partial [Acidobacteriota bacterium]
DDEGRSVSSAVHSIPNGGVFQVGAAELFEFPRDQFVGWIRVSSATAKLIGSVTFASTDGSKLAALPLQESGARESVLGHVAQTDDIYTGITVLNPQAHSALLSIEVFSADGQLTGRRLTSLKGNSKQALLLNEWIPGIDDQVGGFIRIRSTRPLMAFELFGSDAYLAAVPQQVLVP